jgi:hypothetical protein
MKQFAFLIAFPTSPIRDILFLKTGYWKPSPVHVSIWSECLLTDLLSYNDFILSG